MADDFGLTEEINQAILLAHRCGPLTGAALMMAQPATDSAVNSAHATPTLQIGWHLHLNDSAPATTARWPWGRSPVRAGFRIGLTRSGYALMREEVARQWELFRATGLTCLFINSHHHLHAHPFVYRALLDVVGPRFQGWIRLGHPRPFHPTGLMLLWSALNSVYLDRRRKLSAWRTPDTLWGLDRLCSMRADEVQRAMAALPDGFHEFLFHPRTPSCPDTLCLLDLPPRLHSS